MKKSILSLIALVLLVLSGSLSAQILPRIILQGTNATLRWTSTPGETYFVHYRRAFHPDPSLQWKLIGTNLLATGTETAFQHNGGVPRITAGVGGGGSGGGGSPPVMMSATLATTDPTPTDSVEKGQQKDSGPPAFPTLPDEKEIEKWFKELLKEYERQQREGGGVQTFSALMASTLTATQATNNSMGYYAVSRATDDSDGDGLPDWWEATYGLKLLLNDAAEDTDGDGVSNLAEYNYGTNPRDPASKPVPAITFTSAVNTATYLPVVQITGSINLNVRTLTYDLTNAAGVQTGLEGFVTRRTVVPGAGFTNSPARYTNSFQCFDVPLTNGVNTVTLRFADSYGLTFATTVSFGVSFSASPAAPVGTVFWPGTGAAIASDTFTIRGRVDNPTATVIARMTLDGEEQEIGGLVERDGTFWIEDLPTPTAGTVKLVFTDAGGKASTNTLTLSRAPVTFVLNPPTGADLWSNTVDLSGTVSPTNYVFWVNSRRASVDASGAWTATNVPVNAGGVTTFAIRGGAAVSVVPKSFPPPMAGNGGQGGLYTVPTGNLGNFGDGSSVDAAFDFDKPPRIVVASYTRRFQDDDPTPTHGHTNRQTLDWTRTGAGYSGSSTAFSVYPRDAYTQWWTTQSVTYPFPGTNGTSVTTSLNQSNVAFSYTNTAYDPPTIPWETGATYQRTADRNYSYKGETQLELQIGGRGFASSGSLHEFSALAAAYNAEGGWVNLAPESLRVLEQALDAAGYTYRTNLPSNTTLALTFAAVNAAAQAPPTSQASGGTRNVFSVNTGDIQLRLGQPPYYGRSSSTGSGRLIRTNAPPLYLGYGRFVFPYQLSFRLQPDGIQHMVTGADPLVIQYRYDTGISAGSNAFVWDGVVPPKTVGGVTTNQRTNTHQFVNPQLTSLRMQVDAWKGLRGTNQATLKQPAPSIRVVGKAVVAGSGTSGDAHLATISGHLQTMRYTVDTEPRLLMSNLTNRVQHGLVWYSITHALTNSTGLTGLSLRPPFGANETLTPPQLPPGLNYSLIFLNGCGSLMNGNGVTTNFAQRFGPNCAVVGWETPTVLEPVAELVAVTFFDALRSGISVQDAVSEVHRIRGDDQVHNVLPIRVRDVFKVLTNGHVIIDLTR